MAEEEEEDIAIAFLLCDPRVDVSLEPCLGCKQAEDGERKGDLSPKHHQPQRYNGLHTTGLILLAGNESRGHHQPHPSISHAKAAVQEEEQQLRSPKEARANRVSIHKTPLAIS